MTWINSDNIATWAGRQDAIATLPELLHALVRATSPKSTFARFPTYKQIFNPGIDGFVHSAERSGYVPDGVSVWEVSVRKDIAVKADDDYTKRTNSANGYDPGESTFIFVTALSWSGKEDWVTAKMAEGKWKEVRAYDCGDIASWLSIAEVVARDYAPKISFYPTDSVQTAKDFWLEFSVGPDKIQLHPSIVTAGREFLATEIRSFLAGEPAIKAIRGRSKDEVIAFIIGTVKQFTEEEQAAFFSKCLIVDSENNFRSISSKEQSLILISRVEKTKIIYRGPAEGNHVFLPLGADDVYNGDALSLPDVGRSGIVSSLQETGFTEERAETLARESGHSITILKRLLNFPILKSEWANANQAESTIPALLLGRWDERKEGDKEALSIIARKSYDDIIRQIGIWKHNEIPFIYQIGETWRLASPLDAWVNLSRYVTKSDLDNLEYVFLYVLAKVRPSFDLPPEKRYMASLYNKQSAYSEWLREGLAQSLILIAIYGQGLQLPTGGGSSQRWVDSVVNKLLESASGNLWASLNYVLPLIAEASPESFLSSAEKSIHADQPEILKMFEEEQSFVLSTSNHSGLLWALEALAWLPEYLPRVTIILGRLAGLDPGGKLSNRPFNSIRSIFLPWMPQTFADLEKRNQALELLVKYESQIAWRVLISLLPRHNDVAYPTYKTRWRLFDHKSERKNLTNGEIWQNHALIVKNLLSNTDFDEARIAELVEIISDLSDRDRQSIVDYITTNVNTIIQIDYAIPKALQKMLRRHRSFPDANWTLPETELIKIEKLYELMRPIDVINKNKWLFDEHWPMVEGIKRHEDHIKQEEVIREKRVEALVDIFNELGLRRVLELSNEVKEKIVFGDIAAHVLLDNDAILEFLSELRLTDKDQDSVRGFVFRKSWLNDVDWIKEMFEELKELKYSNLALANFLIPSKQSMELWNIVDNSNEEIISRYWRNVHLYLHYLSYQEKIYAIDKLIQFGRSLTALELVQRHISEMPTVLILRALDAGTNSKENKVVPSYEIEQIFSELDKKKDIDRSNLAQLEWRYLSILTRNYSSRKPEILYEKLANDPAFFVQVLKMLYKPNLEAEQEEVLSDEEMQRRSIIAHNAYELLTSWKRIPGMNASTKSIDSEILMGWVLKARHLAENEHRIDAADIHIGKLLSQYPEGDGQWPPDAICEIIDTINSTVLLRSFRDETFNKRGFSSKAPLEGGERERKIAEYFNGLAKQILYKWPVTASILSNLATDYAEDAIREDERAKRDSLEP